MFSQMRIQDFSKAGGGGGGGRQARKADICCDVEQNDIMWSEEFDSTFITIFVYLVMTSLNNCIDNVQC